MDFGFSEQQDMLREEWRKFLDREIPILRAREMGEAGRFDPALWRQIAELGWAALVIPEEYGGLELGLIDLLVLAEEHGRSCQPGLLLSTSGVACVLVEQGSDAQRAEWLPQIASGECRATWAHFERDNRWSPHEIELRAESTRDGFVLSGTKRLVSDAVDAELFLVTAQTDEGARLFLVPASSQGVEIVPHVGLDLTRSLAEVRLDGVAVGEQAMLPPSAEGIERAMRIAIVLQCGESLGVAESLMEMTVEYAKERVQFGRPIGSFQAIRHKCADMRIALDGIRGLTRFAALAVQDGFADVDEAVWAAKAHVGEATAYIAGEALQIHGGVGFTWEYDVHVLLRRAKSNQVLWGDPAGCHERIAARMLGESAA